MITCALRTATVVTLALCWLGCTEDPNDDDDDTTDDFVPEAIDPDRMFADVEVLASAEFAGREPGTPGNDLTVDYVEAIFEELGLLPVGEEGSYRQHFPFERWESTAPSELSLDGEVLQEGTEFWPVGLSGSGTVAAEIAFAGYGMTVPPFDAADYPDCPLDPAGYDDYEGLDAEGKVVVVLRHGPDDDQEIHDSCPASEAAIADEALWNFGYKAANARLHGAEAMLLVQNYAYPSSLVEGDLGTGYHDEDFPVLTVDRDALEVFLPDLSAWASTIDSTWLPASSLTGVEATLEVTAEVIEHQIPNLLGAVPGRSDEVVVIGAHMDHLGTDPLSGDIYNGADDNASGTAVMLELARILVGSGFEPERTVLFAGFNAEESGLIGSCYYTGLPSYPHEDTVAMISVDMVGAGDGTGLNLYGALYEEYTWLAQLMDLSAEERDLPYDVVANMPVLASDHVCFITQGITAVLASTTGAHLNYHTPDDDIDNITDDDMNTATHLLWAALEPLAMAAEAPYLEEEWDPLAMTEAPPVEPPTTY